MFVFPVACPQRPPCYDVIGGLRLASEAKIKAIERPGL